MNIWKSNYDYWSQDELTKNKFISTFASVARLVFQRNDEVHSPEPGSCLPFSFVLPHSPSFPF